MSYDVVIIGGGVCGAAIARELSRYTGSICLVERCEDVCCGTSKANSAIVHAGFDARPGSLMARLNVAGAKAMAALSRTLDFPYRQIGSLVLCCDEAQRHRPVSGGRRAEGLPCLRLAGRAAGHP